MSDQQAHFGDWQYGIYLRGMGMGERPELPVAWDVLERAASEKLGEAPRGYVWGGAGTGDTMRANLDALRAWRIVPRHLRAVETRDLSVEVLGSTLPAPVALAPIGVQTIVHPEGELASARGAAAVGVPYTASTAATHPMESIAAVGGTRWYQLYWPKDDELTVSFLRRARAVGYTHLVITLDTTLLGWRPLDLDRGYSPFLENLGIANYTSDAVFRRRLKAPAEVDPVAAGATFASLFQNPGLSWRQLPLVRRNWDGPILLKGILHPDDARLAVDHGMDGVVVSNHGGRQVDGAIGTLDALPAVVEAVPDDFPVLLDSGIRSAADAFKALALGASAVLLGRPYVWALAVGGEAAVTQLVRGFLAELDLTLALSGHTSFGALGSDVLRRVDKPL